MSATAPSPLPAADPAESSTAVARNAFHLVLGQAGTTVLAIVLSAALGRTLGAADFGLYYLVTSIMTFAYVLVEWGQGTCVIRSVARAPERSGVLLGTLLSVRVAGSVGAAVLTTLTVWGLGYDNRTRVFAAVLMAANLPTFLTQAHNILFRGLERMEFDALLLVVAKVFNLVAILPVLAMGGGLLGVILAQGAAGVAALGVAAVLVRRLHLPPLQVSCAAARELLVEGTPVVALTLAVIAQQYLDAIVLSKLAPAVAVGWFAAARNFMGSLSTPAAILGTASFPRLARSAGDVPRFRTELRMALRPLLGLGALAAVGTYLFADLAVRVVYTKAQYEPAIAILRVFAPSLLMLFIDMLFASAIIAAGKPRLLATAKFVNVGLVTALDYLLVPWCQQRYGNGGLGIVLALAIGEPMMLASSIWLMPRGVVDRSMLVDLGRALLAGAGTLLLFRLLPAIPPVLGVPLSVLAFAGLAYGFGLVRRDDLSTFQRAIARRKPPREGA